MKKCLPVVLLGLVAALALSLAAPPEKTKTIILQQGLDGYQGVEDTSISDAYRPEKGKIASNLSFGGGTELAVYERGSTSENARALIRFDLSGIKGKIVGAELVLTKSAQSPNGDNFLNETILLYRISTANQGWKAGTKDRSPQAGAAVWNLKADPATPWAGEAGLAAAGVDYVEQPVASAQTGTELSAPVVFSFDEVDFLNEWAQKPGLNAGFLLKEEDSFVNGKDRFYSSDCAGDLQSFRPKLILTVVPL